MTIDQPGAIQPVPPEGGTDRRRTESPEEAARQFETILVRQFVATMTKDLFKDTLSGDEGPGWIASQQDVQRDVLTDVLTEHLVENRVLNIADLLLRQWGRQQAAAESAASEGEKP